MKDNKIDVTEDNIFADLGLDNADELLARSELLSDLNSLIRASKRSQKEIAKILRITQPKVSLLMSGRLSAFSTDTLLHYLRLIGCNIDINIKKPLTLKSRKLSRGTITVRRRTAPRRRIRRSRRLINS